MISKLFLRLYILVVFTLVGVGWSLDKVFEVVADSSEEPDTYGAIFSLISDQLTAIPELQWSSTVSRFARKLKLPVALDELSSIVSNDGEIEGLANGEIVSISDANGETMMQRVAASPYILILGPVGYPDKTLDLEFILTAIFYICLALAILLWVWPLWENLRKLSLATAQFGRGDFNVRAVVAPKSAAAPLADTFNSMADRIQRLIDSHKELTNAVSHDLRTPLARMRFGIDMLQNGADVEAQQRYMKSMHDDIDELETLINEMLTYATFDRDAPDLSMHSTALGPWLDKIIEDARSTTQHIKIQCNDCQSLHDKTVHMEARYMSRALSNLISNAMRYAKSTINVSTQYDDTKAQILVDDDGPGVPAKDRKHIFEAFKKQDNTRDRKSGGFGLGLAIVHRIVQWHGGHVEVTDSPLGGARFQIELPIRQSERDTNK